VISLRLEKHEGAQLPPDLVAKIAFRRIGASQHTKAEECAVFTAARLDARFELTGVLSGEEWVFELTRLRANAIEHDLGEGGQDAEG
jgi:hypothetical protein